MAAEDIAARRGTNAEYPLLLIPRRIQNVTNGTMKLEQQKLKTGLFGRQGLYLARMTGPGRLGILTRSRLSRRADPREREFSRVRDRPLRRQAEQSLG